MGLRAIIIDVRDLDEVMEHYDAIVIERSVSGSTGPFLEITATDARITLQPGVYRYEFFDGTGKPGYFYRFRWINRLTGDLGLPSDPVPGGSHPAFDLLSVRELREVYLAGVDLRDDSGVPFSDTLFEWYIRSAVAQAERLLDLPLISRTYSDTSAHSPDFPAEWHDFVIQDYTPYIQLQSLHFPIEAIYGVSMQLPSRQTIIDYPLDWVQGNSDLDTGKIYVIPGSGNVAMVQLGAFSNWLPHVYGWTKTLPNVFRLEYRVGFGRLGGVPYDIRDMIGMLASFGPLNVAGDLVLGAGVAQESLSIDAISTSISTTQSATNAGYGARLATYRQKLKELVPEIRRAYKGVRMVSV